MNKYLSNQATESIIKYGKAFHCLIKYNAIKIYRGVEVI
jgi:hypothetical protein